MKAKVIKITDLEIEFDNGFKLLSVHEQDCCEGHWLSFKDLTLNDFDELMFNLDSDKFFTKIENYGISLNPIKGHSVKIPGYGFNNGYYSTNLTLVLTNGKDRRTYDITECQVVND